MNVKIHIQKKNGERKYINKDYTIKEAKDKFKKEFKNNDNIVYVYLVSSGTWRDYFHSSLKDVRQQYDKCLICSIPKALNAIKYCWDCKELVTKVKPKVELYKKVIKELEK